MKPVFIIDGARFDTLEGFFDEVSRQLVPGVDWGHNLDAFHDLLAGKFGTPAGGFFLLWKDHDQSRFALGHVEMARLLHLTLDQVVDEEHFDQVQAMLEAALCGTGPTVYEWVLDIIRNHGPDGARPEDGVELRLL